MTVTTEADIRQPLKVDPDIFRPDPHKGFASVRPRSGLIDMGIGMLTVTRHGDVETLMTDPRTRQMETEALAIRGISDGALHNFFANSMLTSNPPAHARRRGPAVKAFAFKLIQAWRPRIRAIVSDMIDEVIDGGECDFLTSFAAPLPAHLTAEILGAPREDAPEFAAKVYTMARGLGGFRQSDFEMIETAAAELTAYVEELVAERRRTPRDDFLSDYLARVDEAGDLSEAETIIQIVTLIIGGSDTTRFGLTALVYNLLRERDQWEAVTADETLASEAVKEGLRFEPPAGTIGRIVVEPLEIDGIALAPGTPLSLSIISAQRDEAVYANPERFDISRTDHPRWSLTFGHGPHRCLGEALARAEMEEALIALTQKLPSLELIGEPPALKGHMGVRGVGPMQVGWREKRV